METKEAGRRTQWTAEMDERLLTMKAEGRSLEEMAIELGLGVKGIQNHLYHLKKVKGAFALDGKSDACGVGAESDAEKVAPSPSRATDAEAAAGGLNDLETVMAETISELKAEVDRLRGDKKELEDGQAELAAENIELKKQLCSLCEKAADFESQLADKAAALARAEAALDDEREGMRLVCTELEKSKVIIKEHERDVEVLNGEIERLKRRGECEEGSFREVVREKDERLTVMEAERERYLNLIVGLSERMVSGAS